MPLSVGMLERFKNLVSENDENLLKVNLADGTAVYGYLREVGVDFFILEEIRSVAVDRNEHDRYARFSDYEYKREKLGRTTLPLEPIKSWTEITDDALSSHGFVDN